MINAYLAAIPSFYEGEAIEVRYSLVREGKQPSREKLFIDYKKPAIVGLVSVQVLLKKLAKSTEDEIVVFINDASLSELLKGNSQTKNLDVKRMYPKTMELLKPFRHLTFVNVTQDPKALEKWDELTKA